MAFRKASLCAAFSIAVTLSATAPAAAQDLAFDEFRFGGTWAQPDFVDSNHAEKDQAGVNIEFLTTPVNLDVGGIATNAFLRRMLSPRLHIGGVANFNKNGTSYGYAGLTWRHPLTEGVFVETSFGGSVNNGNINGNAQRASLGSNVTFRESFALGVNLTESSVMLLQIDHNSHAGLAGRKNRGLTALHLKFGMKF